MTVTNESFTIEKRIGLSSDTKPVGLPIGSEFYEYDTGQTYVTYDGTNWAQKKSEPFGFFATKSITFAGGTPNAIGDHDGTGDPASVFTVTGDVIVKIIAVCTTDLTFDANATIELGIAGATAGIIAQTDLTTEGLAAREIWHDATPDAEIEALTVEKDFIITDGNDIILTVGTANVTGGVIAFYCFWTPLSSNASVVAA